MANGTLQSLFRQSKNRLTGRAAFVQAVSRISSGNTKKNADDRKTAKDEEKAA